MIFFVENTLLARNGWKLLLWKWLIAQNSVSAMSWNCLSNEFFVQNFMLNFFVCDHLFRKRHPGALRKEIVSIKTVFCTKHDLIEELKFLAPREFCAEF